MLGGTEIERLPDAVHGQAGLQIGRGIVEIAQIHLGIHGDEKAPGAAVRGGHRLPVAGEIDEHPVVRPHVLLVRHLRQRIAHPLQRGLLIEEHGDIGSREPVEIHQHRPQLLHVILRILQLPHMLVLIDADEQHVQIGIEGRPRRDAQRNRRRTPAARRNGRRVLREQGRQA